jgi:hypothetical protein
MGFNNCDNCGGPISWDKQRRAALNTKRPLNHDGTIHSCGGNGMQQPQSQQKPTTGYVRTATAPSAAGHPEYNEVQQQKTDDIKAAQKERKRQHIEFIKNLQWNTKMLAHLNETSGGGKAEDILDAIGFEEFRQEQQESFMDDVV